VVVAVTVTAPAVSAPLVTAYRDTDLENAGNIPTSAPLTWSVCCGATAAADWLAIGASTAARQVSSVPRIHLVTNRGYVAPRRDEVGLPEMHDPSRAAPGTDR
jgi:hypothetical protein